MSDLYIEARLQAIKEIASTSCSDIKDADNIASFCDEIYSAIPKLDKVVEELNKLDVKAITRYKGGTFGDYEGTDYYIKKSDAIEIVKQGGDVDYVCKWRIVDRPHNLPIYNTSCGKIRMQYTTGVDIYCNGCGKKIKIVGD